MLKFFCLVLSFALAFPVNAYAADVSVSAQSAAVLQSNGGNFLYLKNPDEKRPIASTTKIMTCLLACESGRLDEIVTVTDEMLKDCEGSMIYISPGDRISLYDLTVGAMLASGNDAARAIAVFIGKSSGDFAKMMNKKASLLGMADTNFVTASGLDDDNHYSTARDMAVLALYAVKNSIFSKLCKMKSAKITVNGSQKTIYNHNKLLSYDDNFIGVKTGYTQKSGRCLVSAYNYGGCIIIIVTLNDPDDWQDHKKLVRYSKQKLKTLKKSKSFEIPLVGGSAYYVKCRADINITYYSDYTVRCYYYPFVYYPVSSNDVVGVCRIYSQNKIIGFADIKVV